MCNEEQQIPTVDAYVAALRSLAAEFTDFQRKLLVALRRSSDGPVSVPAIAQQLRAEADEVNDGIFGICRLLQTALGDDAWSGLAPMETMTATTFGVKNRKWLWTMGPGLDEALVRLGWAQIDHTVTH
jgi:hypothetical protein